MLSHWLVTNVIVATIDQYSLIEQSLMFCIYVAKKEVKKSQPKTPWL